MWGSGRHSRQETLIYIVVWSVLFLAPLFSIQLHQGQVDTTSYPWHILFEVWKQLGIFFVAFLLHNGLLAPLIVYRQRRWLYLSSISVLLALFVAVQCAEKPPVDQHRGPRHEQMAEHHAPPHDRDGAFRPERPPHFDKHRKPKGGPPALIGQHDLVATIIFVLMLGMNIGVKLYFKQREDQSHLADLERQNLSQQLEFLKYQINPHFMMNTLNNIHALVDIDPEEAKETIVELSKIMRFVLYEGSKQLVPLSRELVFLENYIRLMWKRVSDQVQISVDLPSKVSEHEVPPLLLITFVENAFKHGVSYQQASFIEISVKLSDEWLSFTCRNSKVPQSQKQAGGVGLQNARQRLELIYGTRYSLDIKDEAESYNVSLKIPLNNPSV